MYAGSSLVQLVWFPLMWISYTFVTVIILCVFRPHSVVPEVRVCSRSLVAKVDRACTGLCVV